MGKNAEQKETIKNLMEGGVGVENGGAGGNVLENLVEKRKELIQALKNEESLLSTLKMRVYFKERAVQRSNLINLTQNSLEKSNVKNAKGIETLTRKIERKEERRSSLLEELRTNQSTLESITNSNPEESGSKIALLQIALMEREAESSHLHNLIATMGGELEKSETGLTSCLPILKQNHMMCRAHEIASKEDQGKFDEMVGQLTGNRVSWAEKVGTSDELMSATSIYAQVSRLHLPTLMHATSSRPASVEQKNLFGVDEDSNPASSDANVDNVNEMVHKSEENIIPQVNVEAEPLFPTRDTITSVEDEVFPATPQLERENSGQLRRLSEMTADSSFLETPPASALCSNTPLVHRSGSTAASPVSSRSHVGSPTIPVASQVSATPVMEELSVSQLRAACQNNLVALQSGSRSNTPDLEYPSKFDTPEPPEMSEATGVSAVVHEEHSGTPKRPAERATGDDGSPLENKRLRLDETFVPSEPVWTEHRAAEVIPATPVQARPNMDGTFDADSPTATTSGFNETITLVAKLDEQCDLGSPMGAPAAKQADSLMNSTFAIEGIEPMEVDPTEDLAKFCPEMSIIAAPKYIPPLPNKTGSGSPVKAGFGLSPAPVKRALTPSPLRSSTLLDMKEEQDLPNLQSNQNQ